MKRSLKKLLKKYIKTLNKKFSEERWENENSIDIGGIIHVIIIWHATIIRSKVFSDFYGVARSKYYDHTLC